MEPSFRALLGVLDPARPVLIQTHDFPDHDAVGAAYGLSELLLRRDFSCSITYGGRIQSISLSSMVDRLDIELMPFDRACADPSLQTIVVDGSPGSGTVATVAGTLTAVIDHHPAWKTVTCPYIDLRVSAGSCCSIVWTYWKEAGDEPDRTTATALLAGIQLDTDFLSRRVSGIDLDAHYNLFFKGNPELAREVVRTSLRVDELAEIARAMGSVRIAGAILLAELHGDYSTELLSVLADFLLRLQEITFVVVLQMDGGGYRLSARSRDRNIDTGYIVRETLSGIGSGGGHPHMAGGIIDPGKYPGTDAFLGRIADTIAAYRSTNETDSQKDRA